MREASSRLKEALVLFFWLQNAFWIADSFVTTTIQQQQQNSPRRQSAQYYYGVEQQPKFCGDNTIKGNLQGTEVFVPSSSWPNEGDACCELSSFHIYNPISDIDQSAAAWRKLCPSASNENNGNFFLSIPFTVQRSRPNRIQSLDVTRLWTLDDDPLHVAADMVRECVHFQCDGDCATPSTDDAAKEQILLSSLSESLITYRDFCKTYLIPFIPKRDNNNIRFKCRLVATIGTSGAKCPQYHIDQVPVRWIQTFVGPGVELVVGNKGVQWDAFQTANGEDDDDSPIEMEKVSWTPEERNRQLLDPNLANVYRVQEGTAVLMLGNEWNNYVTSVHSSKGAQIQPVVHKSPIISSTTQPRVLLTQDILFD
ncbi:DUF1826 domain containing protein [Nitzschia inconspicua]|uniref:DUF1826 domain containing protein n=1 Tax=Nitzschia inconspicua TaxID=303405 RepID=A0A9K3PBH8_9STRA|nr:DUF1826 domain containing protein [Nitzschia inconspicua]KAG7347540.1 DUF1826 domain containing protein [Nitzschia inconspicua]